MNGIKCTSTGTCKGTHNHETPNPFEHMKNVRQSYLQTETFDFSVPYVFVYIERIKFDSNAPLHHLSPVLKHQEMKKNNNNQILNRVIITKTTPFSYIRIYAMMQSFIWHLGSTTSTCTMKECHFFTFIHKRFTCSMLPLRLNFFLRTFCIATSDGTGNLI